MSVNSTCIKVFVGKGGYEIEIPDNDLAPWLATKNLKPKVIHDKIETGVNDINELETLLSEYCANKGNCFLRVFGENSFQYEDRSLNPAK